MAETNDLREMEAFFENICEFPRGDRPNEDEIIQELENYLNKGGSIDFIFRQKDLFGRYCHGTILHYSAEMSYKKAAECALSKGASISIERSRNEFEISTGRFRNALDISADHYSDQRTDSSYSIFEMIRNRSLELYSSYGLTPFHIHCAIDMQCWDDETRSCLETADINAAVSNESPLWPGLKPILIAARFFNDDLIVRLLDMGVDPIARDLEGNTPLHYVHQNLSFYDERLFAIDGNNTFDSFTGQSHFHIACQNRNSLHIVKRYLDQGVSPDLPKQKHDFKDNDPEQTELHSARSPELVQLLLEYGADLEKEDSNGLTPIQHFFTDLPKFQTTESIESICLLLEVGSNVETVETANVLTSVSTSSVDVKKLFLTCISRMSTLNENLVSEQLKNVYNEFKNQVADNWNETEYSGQCSEELKSLFDLGLRQILDDAVIVKSDFDNKFGSWVDTFDFSSYPIYGRLLKIKTKRKLLESKEKKRKIPQAVPQVRRLFQSLCHLPHLVAAEILWNLNSKELNQFLALFSTEV